MEITYLLSKNEVRIRSPLIPEDSFHRKSLVEKLHCGMLSVRLTLLSLVKIRPHPRIPVVVDINVTDVVKIPASSTCRISSGAMFNTSKLKMESASDTSLP